MANLKDWTDLLRAVAWPLVALTALILFRRSVNNALRRIPFHKATSFKIPGLGEFKMSKTAETSETLAKDTVISALPPPNRSQAVGKREKQ
jgi:hypothetical protein